MSFNRFQLFANPFESNASIIERQIRLRRLESGQEPDAEFPEAEIDDAQRRAAMVRERLRRLGLR
jgi:hypothetical protein